MVQESLDSLVVLSSSIGTSDSEHSSISHDGILRLGHLHDQSISLFLFTVHHEGKGNCQSSDNLLMLRVLSMGDHLLNGVLVCTPEHDQTDSISCSLSNYSAVSIIKKRVFKFLIDIRFL